MAEARGGRHLLDYWAILRRRRWVVYLAVAVATLVALVGSFLATPMYRATATLQVERQNPEILTFKNVAAMDYSYSAYSDFYQTQYKILSSEAVARKAVERRGLTEHPAFEPESGGLHPIAWLRSLLPSSGSRRQADPVTRAVARLKSRLEVSPVRNSHLVQISWVAPDPDAASDVANAVVEAYIQFGMESAYTTSDQATEFLVNQIGTLKKEIAAIEERLQQYGEARRIVSIDDASNITLKALSDLSERRTAVRAALAEKEAVYRAVTGASPDALPEVLRSDLISRLKQEYAAYEAEYSEKTRLFKDDWPGMQTLRSKLDQSRKRLDLETQEIARKVVLTAESDYRKALAEVRNLDALVDQQESAAQALKRDAVEYTNLQSEVRKKRETLNALIARQNEMALSTRLKEMDVTSSNIRVVDRARPPLTPFRPNKKLNVILGLLVGLGLGVGMALFLDYLDNTIQRPEEIERLVGLPALAMIPHHGTPSPTLARVRRREATPAVAETVDLVVHRDGRCAAAEAYRELRTALLLSNPGHPPRHILVTSSVPAEGKSATAVNLAVVLAQLGRSVLLIDSDLRRPRLHRVFDAENGRGVSTYLSGLEDDAKRLVVSTDVDHLDLFTSGPIPPNPSELLNSPVFGEMGAKLIGAGYDHVIYDSPPVLSVADAAIIASVVDATILVLRAGRTPRESLRLAVDKFSQGGIRPIGVVLNDLDVDSHLYAQYRYYGRYETADDEPGAVRDKGRRRSAGRA